MPRRPAVSDEAGFSLVEVLVAAVVLVIGAFAAFSLIDGANVTISTNTARLGGTNLARELIEYSRGTDYDKLQPSQVESTLRARAQISGSGTPWTIERRGVTYTVTTSVCTFDDPKDGLATTPPANACPAAAAVAGAPTTPDQNPDDFRRVTFELSWKARGVQGKSKQSALIVNPAGGLGPRITRLEEPTTQITSNFVDYTLPPLFPVQTTFASAVHWAADDGVSQGDAAGGPKDWSFKWDLGTPYVGPWVRDGIYTLQAQAFDSRGVPGEAKLAAVAINRHAPAAVGGLAGGFNKRFGGGIVDLRWKAADERDIQGYRVYRGSDNAQVCPASGSSPWKSTSCTDPSPSPLADTYTVRALDCDNLKAASCALREGSSAVLLVPMVAGPKPDPPALLTATLEDGLPKLDWPDPPAGSTILFYRIYRDTGTGLSDRYDQTITADTNYSDPHPGPTLVHRYWVTAVDASFNESDPSAPVDSPAGP